MFIISRSSSRAAFSPPVNGITSNQIAKPVAREIGHIMHITNDRSRLTKLRASFGDIKLTLSNFNYILPGNNGLSSPFTGEGEELIRSSASHLKDLSVNSDMNGAMLNMQDIHVQSVIFSYLAHFSLDFFGFLDLDAPLLRMAALLGRLFSIGADYVPDHAINADEAIFQGIMLGVSATLFVRSTLPMTMAAVSLILSADNTHSSAWKNAYAYYHLLLPTGLSMLQFRCLTALGTVDWIKVDPHEILVDEQDGNEYLYWVYSGSTELVLNDGITVTYIESWRDETGKKVEFPGFLADMNFLSALGLNKVKTKKGKKLDDDASGIPTGCIHPQVPIKTGPDGARVMRLDKKRLIELMKYDDDLSEPIQALLVKGMQQMLSVLLNAKRKSKGKSPGSVDDSFLQIDQDECIILEL